jgi:hypothetical protein
MHLHAPKGFNAREPTTKKILRILKVPIGIHEQWSGGGHDKLYSISFPVWLVVDDVTGKLLGSWIILSNRMGIIIAYLFLCLVEEMSGMCICFFSLCMPAHAVHF